MIQVMSLFCVLSLRSPDNAARAIEAGAGDLAIQAMQKFPAAQQMQRNSCLMIRNLVVRNPENRLVLLLQSSKLPFIEQKLFPLYLVFTDTIIYAESLFIEQNPFAQ